MTVNPCTDLVFTVNGRVVKQFKSFPYLVSLLIIYGGALEDVHTHNKKPNGAFVKLYPVWRDKYILLRTINHFFNTNIKSGILYRCGT
jgi:hypothetical protein